MSITAATINTNTLTTDLSWLQEGYTYGVNDSGPWQRFKRRGMNSSIESWASILNSAGWTWTVTREKVDNATNNGISSIEASAGWAFPYLYGTETPENIWELDPQDEQKSLTEADFPYGSISITSKLTREALNKIISDDSAVWSTAMSPSNPTSYNVCSSPANGTIYLFDDGSLVTGGWYVINGTPGNYTSSKPSWIYIHLPSADYASAYSMYLLMKAGNTVFPIEASIIRHSMLTSNLYAVQASYNNMDRLISSPSMYSVEGVPTGLLFNVPTKPSPQQFIQTAGDLVYGWRKIRPAIARLSRMKWRVNQNYIFGLWPTLTFGNTL